MVLQQRTLLHTARCRLLVEEIEGLFSKSKNSKRCKKRKKNDSNCNSGNSNKNEKISADFFSSKIVGLKSVVLSKMIFFAGSFHVFWLQKLLH